MNFSGFNTLFLLNLIRLPLLMGFVYLLSHRLVPELLLVRGWRAFLLPFSGSLLLIAFLDRLLMGSSLSDWATAGSDLTYVFWNWVPILRNTFVLLALAGAASLLKWRERLSTVIPKPGREESHSVVEAKIYSFKSGNEEIHLPLSAISHLSKEENYVIIHTEHRRFLVRTTLGALLDDLPAAEFLRVHRSYVVAVRHLRVVANQHVSLINGAVLPLSRMRKAAVRKALVQSADYASTTAATASNSIKQP